MSLQISTKRFQKEDGTGETGWVEVRDYEKGLNVDFHFGYAHCGTEDAAQASARLFVQALEGVTNLEKLKAIQASLSETIARLEGKQ
ncbi:hypothetical protein CF70_013075 [Cupriavidus sp. SK-3]|uniref:hypothetical protein n=1 Tax=Cupriavidus sp. SK-3 TaxID=1470558 RepID=UPI0004532626|nr:hypothetical protein [Cupriavidus sp. SK-3]KDP85623.1 hypothetical protein CF70_013075 [Cupriavidus sp. SK-3]